MGYTPTIFISPKSRYTRRAKAHLSWQPYLELLKKKKHYATNI